MAQFIPHLRAHAHLGQIHARTHGLSLEMLEFTVSRIMSMPSMLLSIVTVAATADIVIRAIRGRPVRALAAVLMMLLMVFLDVISHFRFMHNIMIGLMPCLLFDFAAGRRRVLVVGVLSVLIVGHLAVSSRLEKPGVRWTTEAETLAFVLEHTRPGDRIVAGDPFLLLSAFPSLPGDRQIVRLVPQPFYLPDFDVAAYRREIRERANVYVGERAWFEQQAIFPLTPQKQVPIFPDAEIASFEFEDREVITARRRAEGKH